MSMDAVLFSLFASESLADKLAAAAGLARGEFFRKRFPDGESYLRFSTSPEKKKVVILADLSDPDAKLWPLLLMASAARDLGAVRVVLVAPYLPYMRQDVRFQPGEAVSSRHFAELLSRYFDALITVDPHLHRYHDLGEIYAIPTSVGHAALPIASWIKRNVPNPLLIGPDNESDQWVAEVAREIGAPYVVLQKKRMGDHEVEISIPRLEQWPGATPVVLDDIVSTAQTMIRTVAHLRSLPLPAPICVGVHAVFAGDAYEKLMASGAQRIATCDSIAHPSNQIELSPVLAEELLKRL